GRSDPKQGSEKDRHREFVLVGRGCPPDRPAPSTSESETRHRPPTLQRIGRAFRSPTAVRSSPRSTTRDQAPLEWRPAMQQAPGCRSRTKRKKPSPRFPPNSPWPRARLFARYAARDTQGLARPIATWPVALRSGQRPAGPGAEPRRHRDPTEGPQPPPPP